MDWSNAKSMIIYIFIVLNIFLFVNITFLVSDKGVSQDAIDNTQKILKKSGIKLECSIPKGDFNVNTYVFDSLNVRELVSLNKNFKNMTKINSDNEFEIQYNKVPECFLENNKEKIKEKLINISKSFSMDLDSCYFDSLKNKNGKIEGNLFLVKENVILFDNKIKYVIESGKLKITFKYYGYRNLSSSKAEIMPVYQILVKNFVKRGNTSICSIDIGVITSKMNDVGEKCQESPLTVWRIKLKNSARYFSASTGVEVFDED